MSESSWSTLIEDPDLNTLLCVADRKGVAGCNPPPPPLFNVPKTKTRPNIYNSPFWSRIFLKTLGEPYSRRAQPVVVINFLEKKTALIYIKTTLVYWWSTFCDAGPTLNRHYLHAPYLLGYDIDPALLLCWAIPEIIFYSPDLFMICYQPLTYLMVNIKYI